MKFTIDSKELKEALNSLAKFIPAKAIISALDGFVLRAKDKTLTFIASNGELATRIVLSSETITEEGETLFVGKFLLDLLKNIPEGMLTFNQTNEESIEVSWSTGNSAMATMNTEGYPKIDFPEDIENPLVFDTKVFGDCLNLASAPAAEDEMRPVMGGVLIDCTTNGCALVGSDSRRMSIASIPETKASEDKQILIAGVNAGPIKAQLKGEKTLLSATDKNLILKSDNVTILCRIMEYKYPNWKQILPTGQSITIEAETDTFIQCINRVATFSSAAKKDIVLTVKKDGKLLLDAKDLSTQTRAHESIDCEVKNLETDELVVGFRNDYFLDGLKNIKDKKVVLKLWDSRKAAIIKSAEVTSRFNYIIMPVAV